jgi:hypothetical protein
MVQTGKEVVLKGKGQLIAFIGVGGGVVKRERGGGE